MAVDKMCISLYPETLAQMDFLRDRMRLNPSIKRSQLIQQIVYELYMRMQSDDGTIIYGGDIDEHIV